MDNKLKITKTAQERGMLDKFKEKINLSGKANEFFSQNFAQVMEAIRQKDDDIRSIYTGTSHGNSTEGDGVSVKDILKSARKNFSNKSYLKCFADIGKFNDKMMKINSLITTSQMNLDKTHNEMLSSDLDDESREYLRSIQNRTATSINNNFILKRAGIFQAISNLFDSHNRAMKFWEKIYPKKMKDFKIQLESLLSVAEKYNSIFISSLKRMSSARNVRNAGLYNTEVQKIKELSTTLNNRFMDFYKKSVKPILDSEEFKAIENKAIENKVDTSQDRSAILPPEPKPEPKQEIKEERLTQPMVEPERTTVPAEPLPEALESKKAYHLFLNKINDMISRGESNLIIKSTINKFANSIKNKDIETYNQLNTLIKDH